MTSEIIRFILDNQLVSIDCRKQNLLPSTTVLDYLRSDEGHKGTKEGCAEGDCGACTVVLAELDANQQLTYRAVDSCLLFLPALQGKQLITIENLAHYSKTGIQLHPVQQAMVDKHASQCGYCTPGLTMSLFAMYKSSTSPSLENISRGLAGNLCRCTGYQSINEAAKLSLHKPDNDVFTNNERQTITSLKHLMVSFDGLEIQHPEQHYFLPKNLHDALGIKQTYPNILVVNGATDVAVRQNKSGIYPTSILDLSMVQEIKQLRTTKGSFMIGAACSVEVLRKLVKKKYTEFSPILEHFASQQIRNIASIGGNLCTASPIGDLLPVLQVLNAKVILQSITSRREMKVSDFITGYRTTQLDKDEILTEIFIPKKAGNFYYFSEKVSTRNDVDIASLCFAMKMHCDDNQIIETIDLIFGGMAARVKHAEETEKFLRGKAVSDALRSELSTVISLDFEPLNDARSTKEYRLMVAQNLIVKALIGWIENNKLTV